MGAADELRKCAEAVEETCVAFTAGEFESGPAILQSAMERLARLRSGMEEADAASLAEGWRLRRSIRQAGALLENAAAYHRGWSTRVAVQTSGYGRGGAPGEMVRPGRVWLEA